jgi:hypothetical protein
MLRWTALASWLIGAFGLTLALVFSDVDLAVYIGAALVVLGPVIALSAVFRLRTPGAVFVFLGSMIPQLLLGVVLYQVSIQA